MDDFDEGGDEELAALLDGIEEGLRPSKEPKLSTLPGDEANLPSASSIKMVPSGSHCIIVHPKQKGNPLLKSITSVPWEFGEIVPDYVMGATTCALFLSIKYHNMNPDYIHERLKLLGKLYELRVLLVQVDLNDPHLALKNLTRICLLADLTLMLAWNADEAGKIIETYKIYENKPPDRIMEKVENDPHQKIVNALTSIRSVNKTDAMTLISTFGSLKNIIQASETKLAQCPGFGTRKASQLYKVLHQPFLKKNNLNKAKGTLNTVDMFEEEMDETEIESIMQKENL